MDVQKTIECICAAQRRAGAVMLSARDAIAQEKSGHRDVVTQYDRQVQEMLMEELASQVSGASFYCEELVDECPLDGKRVFIIDPIDGTMNFLKGMNHSCVSVAFASEGRVLAGCVYDPYMDEMFTASLGYGARLNGHPIHVSAAPLSDCIVHFGTSPYYDAVTEATFSLARRAYEKSLDVRRRGSAALDLCDVAAGRAGVYFEMSLSLWDYAAGALLVREAGGVCTTLDGGPLPLDGTKTSILAGGSAAVGDFRSCI